MPTVEAQRLGELGNAARGGVEVAERERRGLRPGRGALASGGAEIFKPFEERWRDSGKEKEEKRRKERRGGRKMKRERDAERERDKENEKCS